ncbi:MAG: NUDIX domain-containing protein [Ruminiclostridium sp.]|nr:NUDIX domain-containing protein [Ruminiclostridium sp.]
MKTIDIIGENYWGKWTGSHTSCRAVIIRDNKLLLSYETKTDQWMLPGGGLEDGESERECVIRELTEETGCFIRPSECILEIDEYYEDQKFINRYFTGEITGTGCQQLTEREKEVGMEPRWLPLKEIILIFSKHSDYTATDEMRRGMYLREYTALTEIIGSNEADTQ